MILGIIGKPGVNSKCVNDHVAAQGSCPYELVQFLFLLVSFVRCQALLE